MFLLRAKQIGLTIDEVDAFTYGQILDMIIEHNNDDYEYPIMGTKEDFERMMG